jgi:hypothetical protein
MLLATSVVSCRSNLPLQGNKVENGWRVGEIRSFDKVLVKNWGIELRVPGKVQAVRLLAWVSCDRQGGPAHPPLLPAGYVK